MANGMPSMVALLGLLAVAGFQNRDKLGGMLGGLGNNQQDPNRLPQGGQPEQGGLGGMLGGLLGGNNAGGSSSGGLPGGLGSILGGAGAGGLGGVLSGGLGDLVERFNQSGNGTKAQSWVNDGNNEAIDTAELERTLGADTIETLTAQTGLSREELLERLSKTLPDAVNQLTPNGRIPTADEASRFAG